MAITENDPSAKYIQNAFAGLPGAGGITGGPLGGPNLIDVDQDLGRGRGGPGGGRPETRPGGPSTSVRPSGRGTGGAGYTEEDVAAILRGMPPERIAAIQKQMQTVGLLPDSFRAFGFVDGSTRNGFTEVLELSNMRGSNFQTTLDGMETAGKAALAEARREQARQAVQARTYSASDPASVRLAAEDAFQKTLGRKPKPTELDRFVKTWQKMEFDEQRQGFDARDAAADAEFNAQFGDDGGTNAPQGDPVDSLMAAIGTQESGNNYNAKNGRTGAAGKYQIMPKNWPAWAKEAGLGANAERSPANQERVARFKMEQYVERYGQQGAAVAWYAGEGAAREWMKNPNTDRFNRKQGKGNEPSINEYVNQVTARLPGGKRANSPRSESDELWDRLQRLVADAPGPLGLGARSRSRAEQERLYENYRAGRGPKAAKPGTSKHGDGRANDLKYGNEKVRQWVIANAHRYGLALPIYDPSLPRDRDESWHIELAKSPGDSYGRSTVGGPMAGGGAPTATVQRADLGAQAVEFARNANPDETAAYEIGGQFNNLLQILQRGVV